MARIGTDSVNLNADPACADVVFFYVNGNTAQQQAAVAAKFPGKVILGIDVNGSAPSAAVRDWEDGDKGGSLEQWVVDHNQLSGRKDATVYCNRATIAEVRQLTGSQVLGRDYWLWVASLDGTLVAGPGIVACQLVTAPGNYDVSVIWDDSWHPSAAAGDVPHLKANINEGLRALDGALQQVIANAARLPG